MKTPKQYTPSQSGVEIIHKEVAYQGYFQIEKYRLKHRLFAGGWSEPLDRELFQRGNAVGALLYDPLLNQLVLIEQFRIGAYAKGINPWSLELVAGIIKPGEAFKEVVARETQEETGLIVHNITPICEYFPSPGACSEYVALFCGRVDASLAKGIHGLKEEGEDIQVCVMSIDEAYISLSCGRINNAATIIALQWFQQHREKLQQRWLEEEEQPK